MKSKLLKDIYRNAPIIFGSNGIIATLAVAQTILLARFLGVEQFGILAIITSYIIVLDQLSDVRIGEWITKYLSEFWVQKDSVKALAVIKAGLIISIIVGTIASGIGIAITAFIVKHWFHQELSLQSFYIHLIVLPFVALNGYTDSILRFWGNFGKLSIAKVGSAVLKLIALSFILIYDGTLKNVVLVLTGSIIFENLLLLGLTMSVIKQYKQFSWKEAPLILLKNNYLSMKQLLIHTKFRSFIRIFFLRGDILLLGMLSVPEQVGLYKLAKNLIGFLIQISTPIYHVIFPEINKLWHMKDRDKFVRFTRSVTKLTVIVVGSAGFILYFASPFIINAFFKNSFIGAIKLVQIMIIGLTIQQIFSWVFPSILSMNKIKTHNIFSLIIAVFVGVSSFYFLPTYGSLGMAYLYLIYPITITIISLIIIYRELQIQSRLSVEVAL